MILRPLKRLLRALGIVAFKRSSGVYVPEDELPALLLSLCGKPNPTVVDGGAHRGDFVRALRRLAPEARFLCFEPQPDLYAFLMDDFRNDPGVIVVGEALGRETAALHFHVNDASATSSILRGSELNAGSLAQLISTCRTIEVQVTPLDEAISKLGWSSPDIIKLDLQGYDYPALLGAGLSLREAAVVVVEVWFAPVYEASADYLAICNLMQERGFRLFSLSGLHYSGGDRLLWGDAVFVREDSPAWNGVIAG
jgi:FkbM family methyltransferase